MIPELDTTALAESLNNERLLNANKIYPQKNINKHAYSEAYDLFNNASHFFSDKRFQVSLTPYSIHPSNFPQCISSTNTVVCSSKRSVDGAVDGISLCTGFVSPGGYTMIVEYYGRSAESAFGHFVFHAKRLVQEKRPEKLFILFAVVKPVDMAAIMENIKRHLGIPMVKQPDAWLTCSSVQQQAHL